MNLPMLASGAPLMLEDVPALQDEVRGLARRRGAVILAHNYQLPEIQDVADYTGDSLGLSQQAASADAETIVFCGVHFMAETASILCPGKRVLIPDPGAGCSLADSITAAQLGEWKARHPGAVVVMYVNTTAEVKAQSDYCCTSANAVRVVEQIYREHGEDTEILFGPDMFLGAYVEKSLGRSMHVWDGECHVHAGIRPDDISAVRAAHPGADFLIHPECGCSTSVMEYVAAGDLDPAGVRMLSTGGMLAYAQQRVGGVAPGGGANGGSTATGGDDENGGGAGGCGGARSGGADCRGGATSAIVATETGMLHALRKAAPGFEFVAANEAAHCRYMKMITLPKLRDALRDGVHEVKVPAQIARRARVPIERMVAIGWPGG
ncbi:MAG: quinolinate synthase NadA [Solirubrobacteraceae bacterium]